MFRNLYVHVPFCIRKCDYCAFRSVPCAGRDAMERWLNRILSQLEERKEELAPLRTIYLGGGTPSLLPNDLLERLFSALRALPAEQEDFELSIEANPATIDSAKAKILASWATRTTLGVQTFDPVLLRRIGRHGNGPDDARRAADLLHDAGLGNLGIDLMNALPGQTRTGFRYDLESALSLGVEHLSVYAITPEPGTRYAERAPKNPDDDAAQDMWEDAGRLLAERGLPRYEISNYARPGFESRHNCNVWKGQTYLGLGPSAVSFDGIDRWMEEPDLARWLAGEPPERDVVSRETRTREMFVMGLRTTRGWGREEFRTASGADWRNFPERIACVRDGLLVEEADRILPTEKGLSFWNDLAEAFLI